jgi:hypothetical protein
MTETYNIYCDESCHLENDGHNAMILGAIWCPLGETRKIAEDIRGIKVRYGLSPKFEVKWKKVSAAKTEFYLDIVKYFFQNEDLSFRGVVIPDKSKLRHEEFGQAHDDWYYKMYFNLLKVVLDPHCEYRIYIDIKDTNSIVKVRKLREILCNSMYDFDRRIIRQCQPIHSHEVEQIQVADLLTGALSYVNRGLTSSRAKLTLVEEIKSKTQYSLINSTLLRERKFNILVWRAREDNL